MTDLVPLQVRIGLKKNSQHAFPPFNDLSLSLRQDMDWAYFVDLFGGCHYDQVAGHADEDAANGSPSGLWLGMILVPFEFATEAVSHWPDTCKILSEAATKKFYDERCHVRDPEIRDDLDTINAIAARRRLQGKPDRIPEANLDADDVSDRNALDPDHPQAGRRRNKRKTWVGYKAANGIVLHESVE